MTKRIDFDTIARMNPAAQDDFAEIAQALAEATPARMSPPTASGPAPTMGKLTKVSYTHEALIDTIVAHPDISQARLALMFGYTPGWISNLLASDLIQARIAERRKEMVDPVVAQTVEERVRGLMLRSMAVLQEKLDSPAVDDKTALRVYELSSKNLGIGGNAAAAPPSMDPERLERLATRLRDLGCGRVIDVTPQKESTHG